MSTDQRSSKSTSKRSSSVSSSSGGGGATSSSTKKSPLPAAQQSARPPTHLPASPVVSQPQSAALTSSQMLNTPLASGPNVSRASPARRESFDERGAGQAAASSSSSSSRRSTMGGSIATSPPSQPAFVAARPMHDHSTYDSSIYAYQPHHHQHTAAAAAAAAAAQLQAAATTLGVPSSSTSPTQSFVPSPNAMPYSPAAFNGNSSNTTTNLTTTGGEWTQPGPIDGRTHVDEGATGGGASGNGSGGSGVPVLSAPYPGRAASLPGSIHYAQSGRSRSAMPASSTTGAGATGREGGTQGYGNSGASSSSTRLRDNPQLRAQIAQQVANGTLPPSMLSHHNQAQHHQHGHHQQQQQQQPAISYERYTAELTNCIIAFLSPMLPTEEEYRMKEATRRQLERLTGKVSPGAKLLAFGSMANGFALRNSDMDLCCLIAGKDSSEAAQEARQALSASELVERLAEVIRSETDYKVLPLPKARIPIIKLSRASSSEFPYEISCDIGFENRLALENTRLLLSYAMVDPPRLRTLVLFLKVWTKRRKLNTPFMGTLSSYGYTLLVLFFLCHVKRPAILPNLQRIPPTKPLSTEEVELNGHNIYFYDDMATLRKEWQSQSNENVAELLIDFFRYFAKEFVYSRDVISLRTEGGLIPKDGGVWSAELCIEDPFQLGYNVSRTVTKDGLYTIRGEFMRATRILQNRGQRVSTQLAELCEEREDVVARAPDTPPTRHRYMPNGNHPPYYVDARTMRELYYDSLPPRRTSHHVQPSGHGGSFAFEEMARGLGRQRSQMAYPSQAMLAPLSQQGGLSPKPIHKGQDATAAMQALAAGGAVPNSASSTKGASSLRHQQSLGSASSEAEEEGEEQGSVKGGQTRQASGSSAGASRRGSTVPSSGSVGGSDDGESSTSTGTTATGAGIEAQQPTQRAGGEAEKAASKKSSSSGKEEAARRVSPQTTTQPPLSPPAPQHKRRSSSPSKRRTAGNPPHGQPLPQHASARTSPNLHPTVPPRSVVPGSEDGDGEERANDDVGEAWAFGSEIVFGSERFRLHPHPHHHGHRRQTSAGQQSSPAKAETSGIAQQQTPRNATIDAPQRVSPQPTAPSALSPTSPSATSPSATAAQKRASRSFSDGANRSKSLPPRRTLGPTPAPALRDVDDDDDEGIPTESLASASIDDYRSVSGASGSSIAEVDEDEGDALAQGKQASQQRPEGDTADEQEEPPVAEYTAEWAQKQFRQEQREREVTARANGDEGDNEEGDDTIVQSRPHLNGKAARRGDDEKEDDDEEE